MPKGSCRIPMQNEESFVDSCDKSERGPGISIHPIERYLCELVLGAVCGCFTYNLWGVHAIGKNKFSAHSPAPVNFGKKTLVLVM